MFMRANLVFIILFIFAVAILAAFIKLLSTLIFILMLAYLVWLVLRIYSGYNGDIEENFTIFEMFCTNFGAPFFLLLSLKAITI